MTGSNHPRFRLLIGWCCLMSAAILIMTAFLAITKKELNTCSEAVTPHNDKQKGFPPGQSVSYIRLIWDDQKSWICSSPCENSSLSLESDALKIKVNGLYYINAQVSFTNTDKSKANQSKQEGKETVTLLRNKRDGKSKKKLTEVIRYEEGSVSINRMVYLTAGDSISLIIPQSMTLLKNEWETYWEIFSLSNQ
ncbi:lymphotoxin-alpha [Triplophysa rosa]|uniref:lymphotoxin-alpha n=1 Tax=Triplophysa rosa TaxID=992332 RepID=UPI00254608A1|nr:lymphotoxin-alpha [Triplophysa rosa]